MSEHALHQPASPTAPPRDAQMIGHWFEIGRLEDIPRLGARIVHVPEDTVAVFRTAEDQVFALSDRCPHRGGPLSQGIVFDHRVACPLHDWVVDLNTGCAVGPDEGCTLPYPVAVDDDRIFLFLQIERTTDIEGFSAGMPARNGKG